MKEFRPVLVPIIAILVAVAAGMGLRDRTSGETEVSEEKESQAERQKEIPANSLEPVASSARPSPLAGPLESALGFYRWLQTAQKEDLGARFRQYKEDREGLHQSYLAALIARWAELDPEGLVSMAGEDWTTKRALLSARLSKQGDAGLAETPKEALFLARQFLAARHAQFDLSRAREQEVPIQWYVLMWLRRGLSADELLEDASALDAEIVRGIASYYSTQPEPRRTHLLTELLRRLQGSPLEEGARVAVQTSLGGWIRTPLANLKLMTALGLDWSSSNPQVGIGDFFHSALSERPQETVAWLMTLSHEDRAKALGNIFTSTWSGGIGTRGWMDLFAKLPREELPSYLKLGTYLDKELHVRPRATLQWLDETMEREHWSAKDADYARDQIRKQAAMLGKRLASEGTERAMKDLGKIRNPDVRNEVLAGIVGTAIAGDPERARELMGDLREPARSRLENELFRHELQGSTFDEVREGLEGVGDEKRASYVRSVVRDARLSARDRAKLLDHFEFENPDLRNESRMLTLTWANQSPPEVAEWLATHSDLPRFERNVESVVQRWVERDLHAAATWVLELGEGEARDRAAAYVVEQAKDREPHSALEWAASIGDEGMRMKNLREALVNVDRFATEEGEAQAALEKLTLSSDEQQELKVFLRGNE